MWFLSIAQQVLLSLVLFFIKLYYLHLEGKVINNIKINILRVP